MSAVSIHSWAVLSHMQRTSSTSATVENHHRLSNHHDYTLRELSDYQIIQTITINYMHPCTLRIIQTIPMGFHVFCWNYPMVFPWFSHGFPMVFIKDPHLSTSLHRSAPNDRPGPQPRPCTKAPDRPEGPAGSSVSGVEETHMEKTCLEGI